MVASAFPTSPDVFGDTHLALILLLCLATLLLVALIVFLVLERIRCNRAEASLRTSEERIGLVVEAFPDGILLVNENREILLVNALTEKLLGYTRAELIGKKVELLFPERLRSQFSDLCAQFVSSPATRELRKGSELSFWRKDGTELPIEIGATSVQSRAGVLLMVVMAGVSVREHAQSEARQNGDELAHSSRIEILGQMAGSLAHELNQPVTSIMNNANAGRRFITSGRGDIARIDELLVAIVADARRASSIIRGIRGLVRKRDAGRSCIDVNQIVEDVLRLVHSNAVKRHCTVEANLTPGLPMVKANPVLIQQVLLNIIVNAFDAMSDTAEKQRKVIVRSECELSGLVKVSVRDFGQGLPPGATNRIFDHFFSTKPKGLGMGLAIARSIIISHGGELGADNAEGGGAFVYFALPTAGNDSTASAGAVCEQENS